MGSFMKINKNIEILNQECQLLSNTQYTACHLCNRNCNINRSVGKKGYCGVSSTLKLARAALHMWEEPCITGVNGSGTVFFSGCPLRCVFCQNYSIAHASTGKEITSNRLAEIFLELQKKGAHNINLVSPTQYVPQIISAITSAKNQGLTLPIVYNTGSYEQVETIKMLEGYIDIYLPDLKYFDSALSLRYSNATDYFKVASTAIKEMFLQVGEPVFDNDLMKKGMIVRHLVLPGHITDSKLIIKYLYETYGDSIYLSIMNQYTPLDSVKNFPEINRKLTEEEYEEVIDYAIELGVENGFIQEGDTASESFIPEFDSEGV